MLCMKQVYKMPVHEKPDWSVTAALSGPDELLQSAASKMYSSLTYWDLITFH